MLSFENVLDCFELVIQAEICEVLITRHGYVVIVSIVFRKFNFCRSAAVS